MGKGVSEEGVRGGPYRTVRHETWNFAGTVTFEVPWVKFTHFHDSSS